MWTPRHGEIVDGGSDSFPLPEFALVFPKDADRNSVRQVEDIIWRKFKINVDFNCFYGVRDPSSMITKLGNMDEYTIMWSRKEGYTRMARVQINQKKQMNPGVII